MNVKESIENLFDLLKNEGLSQKSVAKELGYSEKTMASLVSRGGNDRFKKILQILLRKTKLEQELQSIGSSSPLAELSQKMKKHMDALTEQADAMKRIIDSNLSSNDIQKSFADRLQAKDRTSDRFEESKVDGKSKPRVQPPVQDKPHAKDK